MLAYLAIAAFVTAGLWPSPGTRALAVNPADQTLTEWFLAQGARFWTGDLSLVSDRMNSPEGINLLANATNLLSGIVLAPVTFLFGAPVSFAVLVAANLAGTASGWYLLFARGFRLHRAGAAAGGLFCGFAPAMLSQSNSHLHITAQILIPLIVYCVLRLTRAQTPVRTGVALGLLIALQLFAGEEVLFLTALTLALLTLSYAVVGWQQLRAALRPLGIGLGVAAGLAIVLLGYPLWVQFAGRQSVPNGLFPPSYFSADLASYLAYSPYSLAGSEESVRLAPNATEMNTFLGWPLLLVVAACTGYLFQSAYVRAALVTGLIAAGLSFGPEIVVGGERTGVAGPYVLLEGLPVVDGALPSRFALILVPLIAGLLALTVHEAMQAADLSRYVMTGGIALALVPLLPVQLGTVSRPEVPGFFSAGHWEKCVRPGGVLVPVPLPTPAAPEPLRWATAANVAFGVPEGFFIGPYGAEGRAAMGVYSQPTAALLHEVHQKGTVPVIGPPEREQAQRDARYWNASCITLGPSTFHDELKLTLDGLYGQGERIAGVWVWRV